MEREGFSRALHPGGIVIHDNRLPLAIDVERFGAGLAKAVPGILDAAKRHVRARAVRRAVDRDKSGPVAADELFDAIAVEGVNRARQPERRAIGQNGSGTRCGFKWPVRERSSGIGRGAG